MPDRKPKKVRRKFKPKPPEAGRNTIEIYPAVQKAEWVKVGAFCRCFGEGDDLYRIAAVYDNMVSLEIGGRAHGLESLTKIYQMGFVEE